MASPYVAAVDLRKRESLVRNALVWNSDQFRSVRDLC